MPEYTLYYFNARGRAETARMLFKAAGVDFKDVRFTSDEWKAQKDNFPMRQLPCLEVDGEKIGQSLAIYGYLAKQFGLHGKDPKQACKIDELLACFEDIFAKFTAAVFEKDETKKATLKSELHDKTLPDWLKNFEVLLEKYDGVYSSKSVTLVEIVIYNFTDLINRVFPGDTVELQPKFKAFKQRVSDDPKLKKWIAERPQTDF